MMGAGKTTLGRQLARHLKRDFFDLDHELEARCGVPVATIFDIEGEEGFRRRETLELDYCSRRPLLYWLQVVGQSLRKKTESFKATWHGGVFTSQC